MWKYCAVLLSTGKVCGNRVLRFVDPQPDDQCWSCYEKLEDQGGFDLGHDYKDTNDGGVPK